VERGKALKILKALEGSYPRARIALEFGDPLELLVATILSAQCTDKRVNMVTPALFKKYKTARDFADADIKEFEQEIRSTGFYRNKAKNIIGAARMVVKDFNGKVPDSMEDLLKLPGVARKTANIVLANGYGKVVGIAVDTHVGRLSQRLGFSKNNDPDKIEQDLLALFPKKEWYKINYLLIEHGRAICNAKKPLCPKCPVQKLCPSALYFLKQYHQQD
jgi:endonuclease-3